MLLEVSAQLPEKRITKSEYIEMYKDIAIAEMNQYKIPASITLAQGILESAHGNSALARNANNHFGIKCHKGWTGKSYTMDDDAKDECFRKYKDPVDSFHDHSQFLLTRNRYAFLFDLKLDDYKAWAKGLKKAGYATNPKYPQLLIKIIEEHKLYNYDKLYNKDHKNQQRLKVQKEIRYRPKDDQRDDFNAISIGANGREIYENNGVKFIYAQKGDSFYKIAQDFNIYTWQVYKYNDLKKNDKVDEGQVLYLQAKKKKCDKEFHVAQPGESLYSISQYYGIKLKKLRKYNNLPKKAEIFPDQKIKLRP
jgi:LysM repeat protein